MVAFGNGIAVSSREVTERMRIERAMRESDERLRAAVDTQLDAFAIYSAVRDSAGRVVDVRTEFINRAACEFSQIAAEDQLGRGLLALFPELGSSRIFELYREVIETGESFAEDGLELNALFGAVGGPRHYDVRIVREGDGLVVSCRDVTRRVLAERRAERFSLIYATLSKADEAIVRIRQRLPLFVRVCRVLVEQGRLRMAWVGEIDQEGWIVPSPTRERCRATSTRSGSPCTRFRRAGGRPASPRGNDGTCSRRTLRRTTGWRRGATPRSRGSIDLRPVSRSWWRIGA